MFLLSCQEEMTKVTLGSLGFSDCGFVFLVREVAFHTEPCLEVITKNLADIVDLVSLEYFAFL